MGSQHPAQWQDHTKLPQGMRARGLWEHPSQHKPNSHSLLEKSSSPLCTGAWPQWLRSPHPHGLGDSSYTKVTAGHKHRTHLHKALCFIYYTLSKRSDGWGGFRHTQTKVSLQSYRCLLQSNSTKHSFLPHRNPPGTGYTKQRGYWQDRPQGRSMVQAVPGEQTAKPCAAHEGRSLAQEKKCCWAANDGSPCGDNQHLHSWPCSPKNKGLTLQNPR